MKLYVCLNNYPYEGYSEPDAIFSTQDAAENFCKMTVNSKNYMGGAMEVFELELGKDYTGEIQKPVFEIGPILY